MLLPAPLIPGRLIRRYKRFLADVALEGGGEVTAHCPNPGAMWGLNEPGIPVWLSRSDKPSRKLAHTLEVVQPREGVLAGINTSRPNALVAEALAEARLPEFAGYATVRREVPYAGRSRVDFLLSGPGRRDCYLEVKNVHMIRAGALAEFPDCVTARGARHMDDLAAMAAAGHRAAVLFVIQMTGAARFALAADIDPGYAAAFARARAAGVEVHVHACRFDAPDGAAPAIALAGPLPLMEG